MAPSRLGRAARTLLPLLLCAAAGHGPAWSDPAVPPACRPPGAVPEEIAAFLVARCYAGWPHDAAKVRKAGPAPGEKAPHGKLRVYYSPEVHAWLKAGRPASGVPDGAFIYKEMYAWDTERYTGGAYMLRRRGGSFDGWYWGGFSARTGAAWGAWAHPGCMKCHASAERELTFSHLPYIEGAAVEEPGAEGHAPRRRDHIQPPPRRARAAAPLPDEPAARRAPGAAFLRRFPIEWPVARATSLRLPDENLADEWVSGPKGPDTFLPSPACASCHRADAPDILSLPSPGEPGWRIDVSPAGEWDGSLMALSGRDPVFFAQLEHEKALRPGYAEYLDDTCYRCHGVLGQRQLRLDRDAPFSHEMIYAGAGHPDAKYGALARDGISCTACHHMAAAGLGKPETFTGQFRAGPAREVYGPYDKDVKARPMENAIGVTPRAGAHLSSSAMCGSCHTVLLPRERAGARGKTPRGEAHHEQATYLEWRNSAYQDEDRPVGRLARSCQSCHMPPAAGARGAPLTSKIADIEEYMPHVKASLPRREIALPLRTPLARHTLVGLNYFVLAMFDQFDRLLGVPQPDPAETEEPEKVVPGPVLTRRETLRLAQEGTAQVELVGAPRRRGDELTFRVRVRNLAGHKLPSGVGFRRAFLEARVLDAAGAALWSSGRTDEVGTLVGADGAPLPCELGDDPRALQPHHQEITRQDQVQIYEERHADSAGRLTISFLGQWELRKDNRLLPRGWRRTARTAFMQPAGVGDDPEYGAEAAAGEDVLTYRVTLPAGAEPRAVEAALYYQALPPSYLQKLFQTASGKETQRLYYIASRLAVPPGSPIAGWRLRIASARAHLP